MKHTRKKTNGMKRHMLLLPIFLVAVVALILGATAPDSWARGWHYGDDWGHHWRHGHDWDHDDDDEDELEFEETWFNIEFNQSDEDLGVRGFVDGEPWKEVEIEDPKGRTIAEIEAKRSMKRQGFAELFFESGEPTLEDVSFKKFLRRFPEGTYEFEGETIKGDEIEGEADFTHVIPCGPVIWADVEDGNIIIKWEDVETVVDLDNSTFENVLCVEPDEMEQELEIVGYRVEVEWEEVLDEGTDEEEEIVHKFGIDATADQNQVTVPPEFIPPGQDYQFEVLAIEASGNQTITEEEDTAP